MHDRLAPWWQKKYLAIQQLATFEEFFQRSDAVWKIQKQNSENNLLYSNCVVSHTYNLDSDV